MDGGPAGRSRETPLYTIDSRRRRPTAVTEGPRPMWRATRSSSRRCKRTLPGLNLSPSYAGKLMDVVTLNPGDEISKGHQGRHAGGRHADAS